MTPHEHTWAEPVSLVLDGTSGDVATRIWAPLARACAFTGCNEWLLEPAPPRARPGWLRRLMYRLRHGKALA